MIDYFLNYTRPNYYEVISYGPRWLTEYKEMDANYRYAGWTLDLMAYWLARAISNRFVMHADEYTISKLENMLNLEVDYTMSLEERRAIVASYLFGSRKLSKTIIQQIIQNCTGCDSDLWWVENVLRIAIYFSGSDITAGLSNLEKVLDRRMPAHIAYDFIGIVKVEKKVFIAASVREIRRLRPAEYVPDQGLEYITAYTTENGDILTDEDDSILI